MSSVGPETSLGSHICCDASLDPPPSATVPQAGFCGLHIPQFWFVYYKFYLKETIK